MTRPLIFLFDPFPLKPCDPRVTPPCQQPLSHTCTHTCTLAQYENFTIVFFFSLQCKFKPSEFCCDFLLRLCACVHVHVRASRLSKQLISVHQSRSPKISVEDELAAAARGC